MGQMPTRWSCAFTLVSPTAGLRITLPNDTRDNPRQKNLLRGFGFCHNKGTAGTKEKNLKYGTKEKILKPNKGTSKSIRPSKIKVDQSNVPLLFKEFSKSCVGWEKRGVCQDNFLIPVTEALLGTVRCQRCKSLAGQPLLLISGSVEQCISPGVGQHHVSHPLQSWPNSLSAFKSSLSMLVKLCEDNCSVTQSRCSFS